MSQLPARLSPDFPDDASDRDEAPSWADLAIMFGFFAVAFFGGALLGYTWSV